MKFIFRTLERINYEIWATISFACGILGIPEGKTRKAVEGTALLGITTLFVTALWACSLEGIFAVIVGLTAGAHAAWQAWCLMFTPPMLEIFDVFSFILTLSVVHNPSNRYRQQH